MQEVALHTCAAVQLCRCSNEGARPIACCWILTFQLPALRMGMMRALLAAGFLGFYKGMRAKIVQSILAAALLMAIKEQLTTATAAVLDPKVTLTHQAYWLRITQAGAFASQGAC